MRLLYVIDSLVPGGAERSLAELAPYLTNGGIDLRIAHFGATGGVEQELLDAGACVTRIGATTRRDRVRQLRSVISAEQPDLVHTTLFEADIAGRLDAASRRLPIVSSLVSMMYGPEHARDRTGQHLKVRAAQGADIVTARLVTRFHAVSLSVAAAMSRRLWIPHARIDVIRRGRDPSKMGRRSAPRAARVRARLGLDGAQTMVLAVARHEHAKGLDVMLRAMPPILDAAPGVRLFVAGSPGRQSRELDHLRESLSLRDAVDFLGARTDVYDLLAAADVFVLPSRREGLPGALLEAMALEAPVVASDIDPVREVVAGDMALLVSPGDPSRLAQAVLRVLDDRSAAGIRALRARDRFEASFTIERSATGMLEFYRAIVG